VDLCAGCILSPGPHEDHAAALVGGAKCMFWCSVDGQTAVVGKLNHLRFSFTYDIIQLSNGSRLKNWDQDQAEGWSCRSNVRVSVSEHNHQQAHSGRNCSFMPSTTWATRSSGRKKTTKLVPESYASSLTQKPPWHNPRLLRDAHAARGTFFSS
jgi:hypothetical protein